MSEELTSNLTKEALKKMFARDVRFDGRKLLDLRDFEITYDVSNKAEGSARIKMGKTEVVVGVKMQVGEPYPDSPDEGNLMVSSDLLPLASPRYESGPPKFDAIELPRLVDRAIRASEIIDFKKLVIKEGEKVWTIVVDIYPINDDGNVIEASSLAALAALKNTVFPEIDKDDKIDYDKKTKNKLPLSKEIIPISFSFYKLGDSIILDPTREEEEACDARITFGISNWNKQIMLNSCQKKGKATLSSDEVETIMEIIPAKFEEFNKKLKKFL